tara:strand:- start:550 stop:978 length:429 start_codon:yes stop_codon:yes gene_type:complete
MANLAVELVTPERTFLLDESNKKIDNVDAVITTGTEGEMTILPNHAPLITALAPGLLTLRSSVGETVFAVSGGFLEVNVNVVSVLADAAECSHEIDVERAKAARDRAREIIDTAVDSDEAMSARGALSRALGRLRAAERGDR